MSAKIIIHIVPALRPQNDGAGDYALNLALALRESYDIQSRFIVCDPKRNGTDRVEDFVIQRLRVRSEAGIWSLLASAREQRSPVLLHYRAYGYHKQGAPVWLYHGIKSWLEEQGGAAGEKRLVTVCYEALPSSFKFWKKESYWGIPQHWLLQEFHRRSKLSVTSSRRLQALLDSVEPHKTLRVPLSGNSSLWDVENPAWKLIASQFQAELFPQFSSPKAGVQPVEAQIKEGKVRTPPAYASGHYAVETSVGIRPRPA